MASSHLLTTKRHRLAPFSRSKQAKSPSPIWPGQLDSYFSFYQHNLAKKRDLLLYQSIFWELCVTKILFPFGQLLNAHCVVVLVSKLDKTSRIMHTGVPPVSFKHLTL